MSWIEPLVAVFESGGALVRTTFLRPWRSESVFPRVESWERTAAQRPSETLGVRFTDLVEANGFLLVMLVNPTRSCCVDRVRVRTSWTEGKTEF